MKLQLLVLVLLIVAFPIIRGEDSCQGLIKWCDPSAAGAQCLNDDACCPASCNIGNDNDCLPECGDGIWQPASETCDNAIPDGEPGACPTTRDNGDPCDDGDPCTTDSSTGSAQNCNLVCTHTQLVGPDDCGLGGGAGDGCCPDGCTSENDSDCPAPACIPQGEPCSITNNNACCAGLTCQQVIGADSLACQPPPS
jgi:hypothetical protein